jgi:transketolase
MLRNTQTDWLACVLLDAARAECFHVISCDSALSFRLEEFAAAYPDRIHEVGAAEQASLAIAFGLASEERRVVVFGFSSFLLFRGFEVLRSLIAYHRANVLVVGGMAGLSHGHDGYMHQIVEDIGLIKLLPEFHIFTPSDKRSVANLTRLGLQLKTPAYIRITRRPVEFGLRQIKSLAKLEPYRVLVQHGRDAVVLTHGMLAPIALEAADELRSIGINVCVTEILHHRPFPISLRKEIDGAQLVVTFEDHRLSGGLSSDLRFADNVECDVLSLGVADNAILRCGSNESLLGHHGLTRRHLVAAIQSRLKM